MKCQKVCWKRIYPISICIPHIITRIKWILFHIFRMIAPLRAKKRRSLSFQRFNLLSSMTLGLCSFVLLKWHVECGADVVLLPTYFIHVETELSGCKESQSYQHTNRIDDLRFLLETASLLTTLLGSQCKMCRKKSKSHKMFFHCYAVWMVNNNNLRCG